jgi:hypothetical protein
MNLHAGAPGREVPWFLKGKICRMGEERMAPARLRSS